MALHNGENVLGETLFEKWVMLGCVHKLKVVYCYCGWRYTIIIILGLLIDITALSILRILRAEMHFCAHLRSSPSILEGPRRMLLNIVQCFEGVWSRKRLNLMQCMSCISCFVGCFQAVISAILLPFVIEFFLYYKGLCYIQFRVWHNRLYNQGLEYLLHTVHFTVGVYVKKRGWSNM